MLTLHEQLKDIEDQEKASLHRLRRYNRLEKYISYLSVFRSIVGFVIDFIIVSLIYGWGNKWKFLDAADFGYIFLYSLFPGAYIFMILVPMLENSFEWLPFKITGINKTDYKLAKSKDYDIRQRKRQIEKEIEIEELRKQREIRLELEKKQREIRLEEERRQKEIWKNREKDFLDKLIDALYKIEARKISIRDAKLIQSQLEEDYVSIKTCKFYFYHTNRYYDNRLESISDILSKYGDPQELVLKPPTTPSTRSTVINKGSGKDLTPVPLKDAPSISKPTPPIHPIYQVTKTDKPADPVNDKTPSSNNTLVSPSSKPITNIPAPVSSTDLTNNNKEESNEMFNPEISLDQLLKGRSDDTSISTKNTHDKPALKLDYSTLSDLRQATGSQGEKYAVEWEKKRLERNGLAKYAKEVKHVSLNDDTLGYDILSYNEDGSYRYIEVKTTTEQFHSPFFMSEAERQAMYRILNYFIYRIYNFDKVTQKGDVAMINCDNNIDKDFNISPVTYKVFPK